jgi:hypothetical protein
MDGFFGPDLNLHETLAQALRRFDPDPSKCNLEHVLVNLDLSRRHVERWDRGFKAFNAGFQECAYDDCVSYINRRLYIAGSEPDPLHVRLFRSLQPGEDVLSLNYDLIADQALTHVESKKGLLQPGSRMGKVLGLVGQQMSRAGPTPPGLMEHEYIGGLYLKLHGSLDWLRCSTEGCFGSLQYFASGQSPLATSHATLSLTPCRYCGAYLESAIIPPAAGKLIQTQGKMSFLWNLAWTSLRCAEDWVFIGISLSLTDFELAWLLRFAAEASTFLKRVIVVNPDGSTAERVRRALHPTAPTFIHFSSVEDYLRSLSA